jgi:drug/metabolite transporter (DMT)-like permease
MVFLVLYIALRYRGGAVTGFRRLGLAGLAVAASFGTSMMCFLVGLKETTVANVLIFQAAARLVAAILAWLWLRERITLSVALAILATIAGIAVMVSDCEGTLIWGDLVSAVMGISFAVMIVLARRYREVSMTSAMCLATPLTALVALPFAQFFVTPSDLALFCR